MGIERDLLFTGDFPISVWAEDFPNRTSKRCAVMPARSTKRDLSAGASAPERIFKSSEDTRVQLAQWATDTAPKLGFEDWAEGRELAVSTNREVEPADVVAALRHCLKRMVTSVEITEKLDPRRKKRSWFVSMRSAPREKDQYICKDTK